MDLDLTRIFVKVIQNGSFTKAAEQLRVPKSTVSKSVARLESETNTKLILRTTRNLTLTAAGRVFYESCLGPIQILEEAQKSLDGQDSVISGVVRLTAPEDLGSQVIAPLIAELTAKHRALRFDLLYTDQVVDLVRGGFDLAVRIGRLNESSFKVKKIGDNVLVTAASPKYLKAHDKIVKPQDLTLHDCLSLSYRQLSTKWILKSGKSVVKVPVLSRIISNQMTSLVNATIAGAGVALIPSHLAQPAIDSGKLIRVLPDWSSPGLAVSLISPLAASSSARLKVTVDHLFPALQKALSL